MDTDDNELEPESDTAPAPQWSGGKAVVNYYFPVRIEVVGALPAAEVLRVADFVFGELDRELATRV